MSNEADMSSLMNQINNMLKSNDIPDDIKNMVNNLKSNYQNNTKNENENNFQNNSGSSMSSGNNSSPEIDMATIMKIKGIMDSMKTGKNDPRTNLLRSLKPYLKDGRKEKIDQYIQLFGIEKVIEMLGPLGGDKPK